MQSALLSSPAPIRTLPPARTSKPTLLFVDDEERILRSLRMLFAQQYKVHTTTSGHEALDILRSEHVHALVSDQRMPIMPGVELLRQARELSPNTMRLLLTGYSDMAAVAASINEGEVFRFIAKPWSPDAIRNTVHTAVDIALQLQNYAPESPVADGETELERILVIDDDPDIAVQIRTLLDEEQPGRHVVEWASDLDGVFRILEKGEVALVIADVCLKGEDITELIISLKRCQAHVLTMTLTAYQDSSLLTNLINHAQIFRFMLKPLRPRIVSRNIQAALERHRALKSRPELTLRHQVAVTPTVTETNTARRIFSFFRGLSLGSSQT